MGSHSWTDGSEALTPGQRARLVADYLAGMTDTYAEKTHRQLFDHTPDLR
nr:hypothetical protein [Marinicella sp. W31]MDC2877524.1 hypothetical protein [Marinicella sp. W31]